MKITPSSTGSRSEAANQAAPATDRKTGAAAATSATGAAEQDSIKLSPLSSELAALEASFHPLLQQLTPGMEPDFELHVGEDGAEGGE